MSEFERLFLILENYLIRKPFPYTWMTGLFLGVGSLYLSILWVILYFSAFVIEEAQRNIWLWIVIGIVVMASIVATPIRRYYFDL